MGNFIANTVLIGKEIEKLPTCHSTNAELMAKNKDCQLKEGYLVWADHQTGGKGQRGNSWESEDGQNILLSFLLKPVFLRLHEQFMLNVVVSLAIRKVLVDQGFDEVTIKWPNDIFIKDKKVAGILIENLVQGPKIDSSIVGVGLNVNQESFGALSQATSLRLECGEILDRVLLLDQLCHELSNYYRDMKKSPEELFTDYKRGLLGWQQERQYKTDTIWPGMIVDVASNGVIKILTEKGLKGFNFKEVTFIH